MAPNLSVEARKRLIKVINKVKKMFPAAHPVKIKTVKKNRSKQNYGRIQLVDKDKKNIYFHITLMQTDYEIMIDTYLHEYAHALAWKLLHNESNDVEFHDEGWAIEYSKLYRMFIDPGNENPNT